MGVRHAESCNAGNRLAKGAADLRRRLPVVARDRELFFDLCMGHRVVLPDLSGATRRNNSAKFIRLATQMGSRMFWRELAMGIDHMCEFGGAGKSGGAQKPAKDSATTCRFT